MIYKCCRGDGEGRKDKGCDGWSRSKTSCMWRVVCVTKWYVKDSVWQRKSGWQSCVKDGVCESCVRKRACDKAVCERWCVTKRCVKHGVAKEGVCRTLLNRGRHITGPFARSKRRHHCAMQSDLQQSLHASVTRECHKHWQLTNNTKNLNITIEMKRHQRPIQCKRATRASPVP